MSGPLRVAAWQCLPGPLDVAGNLARLAAACAQVADNGADVLVTPEMFTSGYDIPAEETLRLAEPADGPTARAVAEITRQTGVAVAYGYPELGSSGEVYNAAQLIDRGQVVGGHRKAHLYGDLDRSRFAPAPDVPGVCTLRGHQVALLICYDVEFPESVRSVALRGAEAVLVPTVYGRSIFPAGRTGAAGSGLPVAGPVGHDGRVRRCRDEVVACPKRGLARGLGQDGGPLGSEQVAVIVAEDGHPFRRNGVKALSARGEQKQSASLGEDQGDRLEVVAGPGQVDERTGDGVPVADLAPQAAVIQFPVQRRQRHQAARRPPWGLGQASVDPPGVWLREPGVQQRRRVHDHPVDRGRRPRFLAWLVHHQEVDVFHHWAKPSRHHDDSRL
jgi:hypothetical protein